MTHNIDKKYKTYKIKTLNDIDDIHTSCKTNSVENATSNAKHLVFFEKNKNDKIIKNIFYTLTWKKVERYRLRSYLNMAYF